MRVYTFRIPKWMSQLTRTCIHLIKPSKQSNKRRKV